MIEALVACAVTLGLWLVLYWALPPVPNIDRPIYQLFFAIKCVGVAVLLTFFLGLEAVSYEWLFSNASNPPLTGESLRMRINRNYLRHTQEQLMLFILGLLGLSYYAVDGTAMRAVVATTITWILSRYVFWIGSHKTPAFRTLGLISTMQSAVVLLYISSRFMYEYVGILGVLILLGIVAIAEVHLFDRALAAHKSTSDVA